MLLFTVGGREPVRAADLTVFAAASLKNALDEIADGLRADNGIGIRLSYAGTSALARQIERGAPADLFIAANPEWMDHLQRTGLIDPGRRRDLIGNRLVVVAPADTAARVPAPAPVEAALSALGEDRLAMAFIEAVPAGIYGKAALETLELWPALAPRVVQVDNVRAALALVARGEVAMGIVYATDAQAEKRVRVLARFDPVLHPPIRYPVAPVRGRAHPAAEAFLAHLAGPAARAIFERHGFAPLSD